MFDDICLFISVINCGNFSLAARKLDISQSTLSKKIVNLETMLGSKLINRDSRNFNLTNDGKVFYDAFYQLEESVNRKLQNIVEHKPIEHLRLLLPSCLVNHPISDSIMELLSIEESIKSQITYFNLTDLSLSIITYDFALLCKFAPFHQAQQNVVFSTRNILITHFSNIEKINANIECLNDLTVIICGNNCSDQIEISHQNLQKNISVTPRQIICTDNVEEIKQYLNNHHLAIAIIPESIVWKQFSGSEIKPVLVEYYFGYTQYELHYNDNNSSSRHSIEPVLNKVVQLIRESLFY